MGSCLLHVSKMTAQRYSSFRVGLDTASRKHYVILCCWLTGDLSLIMCGYMTYFA